MPHPELHLRETDRKFTQTVGLYPGHGAVVNNFLGIKLRDSKFERKGRVQFAFSAPKDTSIIPDEILDREEKRYPALGGNDIGTVLRYLNVGQARQSVYVGEEICIAFKLVNKRGVVVEISSVSPLQVSRFSPEDALFFERQVEKANRFKLDLLQD